MQTDPAPGFFGKLPARGDFLARRVPAAFATAWEGFLTGFTVAAKDALAEAWPEAWLTAPLWHFTLGRGIATQAGASGVMLGSVDRVGRFFPFSIIGAGSAGSRHDPDAWARVVEALALEALDDGFDPDRLDRTLAALGTPPAADGGVRPTGAWPLAIEDDWPAPAADVLSDAGLHPPGLGQSVWWCRGSQRMGPLHIRCDGLPDRRLSAAMVAGGLTA